MVPSISEGARGGCAELQNSFLTSIASRLGDWDTAHSQELRQGISTCGRTALCWKPITGKNRGCRAKRRVLFCACHVGKSYIDKHFKRYNLCHSCWYRIAANATKGVVGLISRLGRQKMPCARCQAMSGNDPSPGNLTPSLRKEHCQNKLTKHIRQKGGDRLSLERDGCETLSAV